MDSSYKFYISYFLSGALGALSVLLILFLILPHIIDISFITKGLCVKASGGYNLYFLDKEFNSETYLSIISGFYTAIITILVTLLGVLAAFTFISIRGATLEKVEEAAEKEMIRYFEKNSTANKIRVYVEDVVPEASLDERITKIEKALEEAGTPPDYKLEVDNEKKTEQAD